MVDYPRPVLMQIGSEQGGREPDYGVPILLDFSSRYHDDKEVGATLPKPTAGTCPAFFLGNQPLGRACFILCANCK